VLLIALSGWLGVALRSNPHAMPPPFEGLQVAEAKPADSGRDIRYDVEPLDDGKYSLTPRAINDRGQVAGSIEDNEGHSQAFLLQNGKLSLLPTLGGANSGASAINNRAQVGRQ
jgi:probable HAF family extracellular repeat protein